MRLFLALEVPSEVRDPLAGWAEQQRPRAPEARWVSPNNYHLTLFFFGEVDEAAAERIPPLMRDAVKDHRPFDLALSGLGSFGTAGAPRVVFASIEQGRKELEQLEQSVKKTILAGGFQAEERAFHPHLTLARSKTGDARFKRILAEPLPVLAGWRAVDLVLFESEVGGPGTRYSPRLRTPLGGG